MVLHNTTQYAIRILNYLANESNNRLVSATTLAEKLDISYKFLTKVMTNLAKEGLVNSVRGREGGFTLARPANEIHISEVFNVISGSLKGPSCILGIKNCDHKEQCALHEQWQEPKRLMLEMFNNTTLDKLRGNEFKV